MALMEAMACEKAVSCSTIRGNVDLIDPEKGGWLMAPTDVDGFAAAIQEAMNHRENWPEMKAHNLAKVQQYGIDAVVEQMAEVYKTLM